MQTFYFDIQDGVPVRDRRGLELANTTMIRQKETPGRKDLLVVVTDESGREVHRETVYPGGD